MREASLTARAPFTPRAAPASLIRVSLAAALLTTPAKVAVFDETDDGTQFLHDAAAMTMQVDSMSLTPLLDSRPIDLSGLPVCPRVGLPAEFASFVDQTVPQAMIAGHTYQVTLTFRNTGPNTWAVGDGYVLTDEGEDSSPQWMIAPVWNSTTPRSTSIPPRGGHPVTDAPLLTGSAEPRQGRDGVNRRAPAAMSGGNGRDLRVRRST